MKIPKYMPERATSTPDLSANRWALRQAEEGMNRVSQGLADVSKTLETIGQEKKKISQATQLGENRVNFENEWINAKTEFDNTNPNPDTYYADASKLFDKTVEKTVKQIKDSEVQQHFKIMMNEHKVTVMDSLGREANQKWLDKNIASKMGQIDMLIDLAGKASDPEYANSYKETARGVIRSMSGNLLHQTKAVELEKAKMQELDEAGVKNHILIDPVGAAKALMVGDYPDLSPKDRPYYKQQAKTAIKVMENDNEDKQVDMMYQKIHRAYGTDYATIYERLRDTDYMKQNFGDVPIKVKTKVEQAFAEEKLRFDQVVHDKSDSVAKDTSLNLRRMTSKEIDRRVKEDGLDWKLGHAFKQELLNPPDVPINPSAYNKALSVVYDDTIPRDQKANAVLASPIPKNEKIGLLGLAWRDENKADDQAVRNGLNIIKEQIGPKTDMLGRMLPFSEEESKSYYYANQQLQDAILEAKKNKKQLTPKEVIDKAFEISHSMKIGMVQKAKIRSGELTSQGKALIEGVKKTEPKKPWETIEEYMKRVHPSINPM